MVVRANHNHDDGIAIPDVGLHFDRLGLNALMAPRPSTLQVFAASAFRTKFL